MKNSKSEFYKWGALSAIYSLAGGILFIGGVVLAPCIGIPAAFGMGLAGIVLGYVSARFGEKTFDVYLNKKLEIKRPLPDERDHEIKESKRQKHQLYGILHP